MAEMKGPGCIWRIWSAAPGGGHVKILGANPKAEKAYMFGISQIDLKPRD